MKIEMIDISGKQEVKRTATASGRITLKPDTVRTIREGNIKKGDVLATAEIAAISAAKNCPSMLPLCHQIPLSKVSTSFSFGKDGIEVSSTVTATAKTGVEMEALCAVSAALLTVWDMVKYLEKDERGQYPETRIEGIRVVEKIKGDARETESTRSHKSSAPVSVDCAVITVSTSRSKGGEDRSGDIIRSLLSSGGHKIVESKIIPDSPEMVEGAIKSSGADAIIFTGGTGLTRTDGTVETARKLFTKEIEGFGELFRVLSYSEAGSGALLSRATAGLVGNKVVFCLPGSPDACELAMKKLVLPELSHIVKHAGEK